MDKTTQDTNIENITDEELLRSISKEGCRKSLEILVRKHMGFVFRQSLQTVNEESLAEDITQEVFIRFIHLIPTVRNPKALRCFLSRLAMTTSLKKLRSISRRRGYEEKANLERRMKNKSILEEFADDEMTGLINKALASLDVKFRLPIVLRYCEGMSVKETAFALDISYSNAKKRLHQGMEQLRGKLKIMGITCSIAVLVSVFPLRQAFAESSALVEKLSRIAADSPLPDPDLHKLLDPFTLHELNMKLVLKITLVLAVVAGAFFVGLKVHGNNSEPAPSSTSVISKIVSTEELPELLKIRGFGDPDVSVKVKMGIPTAPDFIVRLREDFGSTLAPEGTEWVFEDPAAIWNIFSAVETESFEEGLFEGCSPDLEILVGTEYSLTFIGEDVISVFGPVDNYPLGGKWTIKESVLPRLAELLSKRLPVWVP